ncbi:MAG TPA: IS3 family transposase [Nitrospiraceae bacterium]|nr:IS3 family transposase [Nitrospiraceae bacterium]
MRPASGYRAWKEDGTPDRTRLMDAQLLALICAIHGELKGAYGSPRMVRELRGRGFPASKLRVERLMRAHGLHARHKRRYKATADSAHTLPVAVNSVSILKASSGAQQNVQPTLPVLCFSELQPRPLGP